MRTQRDKRYEKKKKNKTKGMRDSSKGNLKNIPPTGL